MSDGSSVDAPADSPPRIGLVVPSLRGGGAERVMVSLANAFARRGFAVDLVACDAVGPYRSEVSDDVRLVDLGAARVSRALLPLARYLREARPNVVLSTMAHANVLAVAARTLAGARRRTRLVLRDALPIAQELGSSRWLSLLAPVVYRGCDALVFVSECQRDRFVERVSLGPRVERCVIVNPVPLERVRALAAEPVGAVPAVRTPFVLGVGRLVAQKDFAMLIEAFARVRSSKRCDLVILGEGEERGALERLVAELDLGGSVHLPGFVSNPFPLMRSASVFALSSRWEGMPNALLQAVALGTPVVATNCDCGPSEALLEGKLGALVDVGDVDAMAIALDEALRRGERTEPPPEWLERFSLDTAATGYLAACGLPGAVAC